MHLLKPGDEQNHQSNNHAHVISRIESRTPLLCQAPNLQNSIMKEPTATPSILGERETRWSGEIIAFV